jgi:hypothetical protein
VATGELVRSDGLPRSAEKIDEVNAGVFEGTVNGVGAEVPVVPTILHCDDGHPRLDVCSAASKFSVARYLSTNTSAVIAHVTLQVQGIICWQHRDNVASSWHVLVASQWSTYNGSTNGTRSFS